MYHDLFSCKAGWVNTRCISTLFSASRPFTGSHGFSCRRSKGALWVSRLYSAVLAVSLCLPCSSILSMHGYFARLLITPPRFELVLFV
ncbi:hypothetical protein BDU57DRAFT_343378 [Ampelomyces quisqualis]|uniref:Uncharacterized protein n=1 Tax=Ampelomyces quisqualis TaxID=50730 RepID=A0A6A5QBX1_AMPQU|nr:hypothetical protein BDU57DRAFT_343378 [Ampelomyces quisqualis]